MENIEIKGGGAHPKYYQGPAFRVVVYLADILVVWGFAFFLLIFNPSVSEWVMDGMYVIGVGLVSGIVLISYFILFKRRQVEEAQWPETLRKILKYAIRAISLVVIFLITRYVITRW